jgi:hypothetical protein
VQLSIDGLLSIQLLNSLLLRYLNMQHYGVQKARQISLVMQGIDDITIIFLYYLVFITLVASI